MTIDTGHTTSNDRLSASYPLPPSAVAAPLSSGAVEGDGDLVQYRRYSLRPLGGSAFVDKSMTRIFEYRVAATDPWADSWITHSQLGHGAWCRTVDEATALDKEVLELIETLHRQLKGQADGAFREELLWRYQCLKGRIVDAYATGKLEGSVRGIAEVTALLKDIYSSAISAVVVGDGAEWVLRDDCWSVTGSDGRLYFLFERQQGVLQSLQEWGEVCCTALDTSRVKTVELHLKHTPQQAGTPVTVKDVARDGRFVIGSELLSRPVVAFSETLLHRLAFDIIDNVNSYEAERGLWPCHLDPGKIFLSPSLKEGVKVQVMISEESLPAGAEIDWNQIEEAFSPPEAFGDEGAEITILRSATLSWQLGMLLYELYRRHEGAALLSPPLMQWVADGLALLAQAQPRDYSVYFSDREAYAALWQGRLTAMDEIVLRLLHPDPLLRSKGDEIENILHDYIMSRVVN